MGLSKFWNRLGQGRGVQLRFEGNKWILKSVRFPSSSFHRIITMYCFCKIWSPLVLTKELKVLFEGSLLNFGSPSKHPDFANICNAPCAAIIKTKAIYCVKLTHRICKQQNKEAAYELFFIIYRNVHGWNLTDNRKAKRTLSYFKTFRSYKVKTVANFAQ